MTFAGSSTSLLIRLAIGWAIASSSVGCARAPSGSSIAPPTSAAATTAPIASAATTAPIASAATTAPITSVAAATTAPISGPVSLINLDVTTQSLAGAESPSAELAVVPITGMPFDHAISVHTQSRPKNPWDIQFKTKTVAAISAGDALLVTFYMRTIDTQDESGEARIALAMQTAGPPFASTLEQELSAPRSWMKVTLPFVSRVSWAAGKAQMTLNFGYDPQTLELADFSLVDYGPKVKVKDLPQPQFTYAGREPDAPWRKEAQDRIEKFRKGDLSINVVDSNGKPVPDATVSIKMTRHAFAFGSAIAAKDLMGITPDDQHYRDVVEHDFNRVVFENDMKWRAWEDVLRRKKTQQAVRWLRNHNIDVRGHCMVWPGWPNLPDSLKLLKDNPTELSAAVDAHITDIATAFAPSHLCEWDVVNETKTNHDLQDVLGHSILPHWYEVAHAAIPNVPLFLNENSVLETGTKVDSFYAELKYLQDEKAPLGGIGLQGHFAWNPTPPAVVVQRLDKFAAFGVPIEVTEFDVNVSDEKFQADYTRDLMTAVFSHPATSGIIMWGFWDTKHWLGNSPLFRRDWTLKPSGQVWMDLVMHQWWTNTTATTDVSGHCQARGFLGDYDIEVKHGAAHRSVKAKLTNSGATVQVVLPT
jgi:endo-1,4-beta-xylanase